MLKPLIALSLLSALFAGCATSQGLHPNSLRQAMGVQPSTSSAIDQLKPQLPKPFKVGVYFKDPVMDGQRWQTESWPWTQSDKNKILTVLRSFETDGEISQFIEISPAVGTSTDTKFLRTVAAQHGADALLVVSLGQDIDKYDNSYAWTYALLIPMLCVPGSNTDVLVMGHAAMWDTRNGYLYLTADSQATRGQTRSLASDHESDLTLAAKSDALDELASRITSSLSSSLSKNQKFKH